MQHRQTISQTQLCALLWASLLAPAAELLPAVTLPWAGKAAWLTTLLAFPVLAAVGWVLSHAAWRRDGPVSYTHLDVYKRQVLAQFSLCYSPLQGRFLTRYSPVRH